MIGYYKKHVLPIYPNNELSHEDCEKLIERHATDIISPSPPHSPGYDDLTGWGRLNAGAIFDSLFFPEFLVKHYKFYVDAVINNNFTLVGYHEKTCLLQSISGVPADPAYVNRWKLTARHSHSLPPGYSILVKP